MVVNDNSSSMMGIMGGEILDDLANLGFYKLL
jgi:hypothetical protein